MIVRNIGIICELILVDLGFFHVNSKYEFGIMKSCVSNFQ
jgi:hypothetical protein